MEHDISILNEKRYVSRNEKTIAACDCAAEAKGRGYNTSCAFASD